MIKRIFIVVMLLLLLYGGYRAVGLIMDLMNPRNSGFIQWWQENGATREALLTVQREACPGAPFILPADGYIGLRYGDPRGPYSSSSPHQRVDIFSQTEPGLTPVYAAYDGYITRESSWVSTVIQRVPSDPLRPEHQISFSWFVYSEGE